MKERKISSPQWSAPHLFPKHLLVPNVMSSTLILFYQSVLVTGVKKLPDYSQYCTEGQHSKERTQVSPWLGGMSLLEDWVVFPSGVGIKVYPLLFVEKRSWDVVHWLCQGGTWVSFSFSCANEFKVTGSAHSTALLSLKDASESARTACPCSSE